MNNAVGSKLSAVSIIQLRYQTTYDINGHNATIEVDRQASQTDFRS